MISLNAQSPNSFKYQAIVRDKSGNLITNKIVNIQISILQGNISGTVVYSEKHYPTSSQFGLVNFEIGKGTTISGSFSSIDWTHGPYFVSIGVNGNILGTSQLLSVPYAKYAEKSGNGFSGNYNDLTNKPAPYDGSWASISGKPNFSNVDLTGSYHDLSELPAIFNGNWSSLKGLPSFATVAVSGKYTDLLNTPFIFSGNYMDLTHKPTLFNGTWDSIKGRPTFATVALSGKYTDLLNTPFIFSGNYADLTHKPTLLTWDSIKGRPTFATVAVSGKYTDLLNTPFIFSGNYADLTHKPALYNWTWDSIKGRPIFAIVAVSGKYTDLLNTPFIFSGNYADLTHKPILFNGTWDSITGKPTFSLVASSGNYNDLLNKPSNLFSGNYIDLSNKPTLFDGPWDSIKGRPVFSKVALTGNYSDLINRPALFSGNYSDLLNPPILFSGNYNDLTNKPILFDGTWTSLFGKPSFSAVALSGSYNDLSTKPNLFNGTWSSLTGQPTTLAGYGITDAMSKSHVANGITTNQINNWNIAFGWGDYSTKGYAIASDYYSKLDLLTNAASLVHWANITSKPSSISGYGISDFMFTSPSNNQLLKYSGGKWINWTPTYGNQQLGLSGTTLAIIGAGGNTVPFTNWDTNSSDDVTLSGTQTISGDKTFSGTITTSATIMATNGLNAVNNKITNVKDPVNGSDIATKLYIDLLKAQLAALQVRYNIILTHMDVTDYDGYVYKTVTIGTQVWMAENLRTTHYMNGDPIATTSPLNLNISDTIAFPEPKYTWPVFGDSANIPEYGRLYTWWAANDNRKVCPSGWHVPSLDEFNILLTTAGGEQAGANLKDSGTAHWVSPNTGNNSTGFSWVGNGNRYPYGFRVFKTYGCIHTSTTSVYNNNIPYHFHARNEYTSVPLDSALYHPKSMGSAVRCLKN